LNEKLKATQPTLYVKYRKARQHDQEVAVSDGN